MEVGRRDDPIQGGVPDRPTRRTSSVADPATDAQAVTRHAANLDANADGPADADAAGRPDHRAQKLRANPKGRRPLAQTGAASGRRPPLARPAIPVPPARNFRDTEGPASDH